MNTPDEIATKRETGKIRKASWGEISGYGCLAGFVLLIPGFFALGSVASYHSWLPGDVFFLFICVVLIPLSFTVSIIAFIAHITERLRKKKEK